MNQLYHWITTLLLFSVTQGMSQNDSFGVYLFLLEDCRISQAYTDRLNELYQEYHNDSIEFKGFFPNPISRVATMEAFVEKYDIQFPCDRFDATEMARSLGIEITPEVAIVNISTQEVLYKGRIDDMYIQVGKRRQVITRNELADALESILHHKPITVKETQAVGCFLTY